jgi:hypothetical protein
MISRIRTKTVAERKTVTPKRWPVEVKNKDA